MQSRLRSHPNGALLSAGVALLTLTACSDARAGAIAASALVDRPLEAHQHRLLDLAFDAASALPTHPHIKSRSRAQEAVVEVALELEQPLRALKFIEQIDNWRRGAGYADLAFYCARKGVGEVQRYLDLAREVTDQADDESVEESAQGWRKDRIKVKIAQTHALLGQAEQAAQLEDGVVPSEVGKVAAAKAMALDAKAFEEQLGALDLMIETSDLDQVRNALEVCTELFNRFYQDEPRRARVEERVKTAGGKLPVTIHLELMIKLSEFALARGDQAKALELVKETKRIMDGAMCEHIPLVARLAGLRHRAGDSESAHGEADAALAKYDQEREEIVNIDRAEVLRPLAEAYQVMGYTATALKVYKRAFEAGVVNPNSRPRSEDLSATCRSMALSGVEPDPELWARIHEIYAKLGDPW